MAGARAVPDGRRAAGIRTFALSGLLGGICATLVSKHGEVLSVGGGIVLGAAILAYAKIMLVLGREQNRARHNYSATTTVAALLTFALGARLFGEQGSLFAAAGGLVSSTAVTLANARRARTGDVPVSTAAFVSVALAAHWIPRTHDDAPAKPALVLRNPFSFPAVVTMALTMGAVIIVSRWLLDRAGALGLYAGAAVTGLFDVDSLVVAVSRNEPLHASASRAAALILLGVLSSTSLKVVVAWVAGPGAFGTRTAVQGLVAKRRGRCSPEVT